MTPLSKEIKNEILKTFSLLKEENIDNFESAYNKIVTEIPYQYLAHIIRTLETYVQEKMDSPFFRITCTPADMGSVAQGLACG